MTNDEDLSRPTVQIKIPEVRLRLQDLAFLRSVSQPQAVRCRVADSVRDRLRFLDLIARAKVPPSEEEVVRVAKEMKKLRAELDVAAQKENWDVVSNAAYSLKNLKRDLDPREDDVLTEKGKALLRQGEVQVRVRKVGCAK